MRLDVKDALYIYTILLVAYQRIRPETHILSVEMGEEIGDCRCGDTYDVAHFAMRTRKSLNRWM